MIKDSQYRLMLLLISLVYLVGLFVTLFENDSAQFAVMAMRMVQENDFLSLVKGTEEYLDKPHMHYWLAALSYKLFGLHDWAYRIPAILVTFLGAYSCYGLGKLLYRREVGWLASLIFLSAQTIVLSGIDVRTDAVLTGFTVFALWQLATYLETSSLRAILLGAFGAAIAFSTKGQIALLVLGLPLLCHIAYKKYWSALIHWKVLLAIVIFGISISPMLYAYYQQFDLHPEKVIRGQSGRSGILFIFWEQSFERLSGEGVGKNSSDYFFFFHTFLWVFLPWTIVGLAAYGKRMKTLVRQRFKKYAGLELMTLGGITLIFIIISFAQFKLPHYLNITIPLFAILSAVFLYELYDSRNRKVLRWLLGFQHFIFGLVILCVSFIGWYVFPSSFGKWFSGFLVIAGLTTWYLLGRVGVYRKLVFLGLMSSLLLNLMLNAYFYPQLLEYQGGSNMAKVVAEEGIPTDRIFKLTDRHTWALDFYNKRPLSKIGPEQLASADNTWLYVTEKERADLQSDGYVWDREYAVDQFRITRLQARFLNPDTRKEVLHQMYLLHLRP
ncbi:glycosyltransferase family 39 protein [Zeaxanthinibacter sp. PT1]|uniref:ArnT family glycosyltransferase n=1 Tax=Zeaxanthinibacter TaxID=561554 RepID=UPI00234ADD4E|nr:glycosyltransferase family 39 protein [Zeaxanthinibacter sp. PT1]MDC6352557.1 glycosyltransferase family 39 protein [Zeaxanthinibacter sp. PT1]